MKLSTWIKKVAETYVRGYHARGIDVKEWGNQVAKLEAENRRLRKALKTIHTLSYNGYVFECLIEAEKALEKK